MRQRRTVAAVLPRGGRAALYASVLLGVLTMHTLFLSSAGDLQPHHEAIAISGFAADVSHAGSAAGVAVALADHADGLSGEMSDCGGLMAWCLALILGVSAYIALQTRALGRVLWQIPRPTTLRSFRVVPPFELRSPLERSSILRC